MRQKIVEAISQFNLRVVLREWAYLTVGAIFSIVGMNIFLAPSKISLGVGGLAIITNSFTGWPIGLLMLIFNIPMLVLGFKYLGRFRFLTSTLYVVLVYNLGVDYLGAWMPAGITDDLLLNALYSAIVGGIGTGLIYRGRGTSAGTGVLGRVLQLKTGVPLSQVYLATDGAVILIAGVVFSWEIALYSVLTLFVWGLVTDYILEGPSVIRTAFIVTDSASTVRDAVFNRLGLGITAWQGRGMFTDVEHTILFCTLSRPDVNSLYAVVAEADPHAFVVIGQGHQARGGVLRQADLLRQAEKQKEKLSKTAAAR